VTYSYLLFKFSENYVISLGRSTDVSMLKRRGATPTGRKYKLCAFFSHFPAKTFPPKCFLATT